MFWYYLSDAAYLATLWYLPFPFSFPHLTVQVGAHTFLELFQAYPDSKDVFHKFQGHDLAMLVQSEIIVQHGQRVMNVVDRVMAAVDSRERVWDLLIQIGREHFSENILIAFKKYRVHINLGKVSPSMVEMELFILHFL